MKILVLGTLLKTSAFSYNSAANPASSKWLYGFTHGLSDHGASITLCGHCYSQVWPRGAIFPGRRSYLESSNPNHLVRFINLPGIRFKSLAHGYLKAAKAVIEAQGADVILTYNPYPWHTFASRKLRYKYGIPWICLNLDFDDVGENWGKFISDAGDADGHLFLSYWGYKNAPVKYKIHIDSGVSKQFCDSKSRQSKDYLNIVYLGKLSSEGGLEILLALPSLIKASNIRFIYGGKGNPNAVSKLLALSERDSRVDFRGFIKDNEVHDLFASADIFLNTRNPNEVVNDMIFPSKIMHYLQYGKTVVSTWTKGLDPIYRNLVVISNGATEKDFADALEMAIKETCKERALRSERINQFIIGSRLWSKQSLRFSEFTRKIISHKQKLPN